MVVETGIGTVVDEEGWAGAARVDDELRPRAQQGAPEERARLVAEWLTRRMNTLLPASVRAVKQTRPDLIVSATLAAPLARDAAGDTSTARVETVARDERWPLPAGYAERTRRAKTFVARAAVDTAVQAAMISGGRSYTPDHPVFRFLCDALAGPLLRPSLPKAMDAIIQQLFPGERDGARAAA